MHNRKKFKDLTKIVKIRELEKKLAEQALSDAKIIEKKRLSEKERAEEALQNSHQNWETHLSEGLMITEHLKYYSDDLFQHMNKHTEVESEYKQAVELSENKISSLQMCDAIVKKTHQIHLKFRRKLIQKDDERTLSIFEDRFTFDWSRKT